ncbi:Ras-responsive element-binding protein 1 [Schistosoma japonicum]|nr:Ras-responsive element-binding protein 1 [Schistosoma japonicum]
MKDYCIVASTTTNSNIISDNTNNYSLNEVKHMKTINYSEENKTPLIKQSIEEYKRNWDVLNASNIIKIKQQDETNQDESHSDSELNLSSESISRKNRADVKIQPYALRGNIEVFRCPLCSKDEIFSRGHLTNHLQDHQSNFKREDYKHVCCFCFSELSSNSSLERHLLTHTNHRPFNCNLCDKAFTTNGNLSRHVRTSHQVKTTTVTNLTSFTSTASTSPTIHSHTTQQSTFLPNWYQSSTNLYMSPISNVYSKTKTSIQHTTEMNEYQDVDNYMQKSSVKQLDLNNHGINSSKKLKFQQANNLFQNRENRCSTSKVNLVQSISNSYNKQCIITDKSCIKNEPNTSSNESESIKPIKFTSINSKECQIDCSSNLSTSSTDNLMDYSINYSKQEQCKDDNFDKFNTIYSWSPNKLNTTTGLIQFFSNYWIQLGKTGVLDNLSHTNLDAKAIIASLLPSTLSKNNTTMHSTFESNNMSSSFTNNEYDINENFVNRLSTNSESPRITICELPTSITMNEREKKFDNQFNKTYIFNPADYVISSSPNLNLQNNPSYQTRSKYVTKTNQNLRQKSARTIKSRSSKTFSVRYILAKKRKSLTVIGKRKQIRKVTEMKCQPLNPVPCDYKRNELYSLKEHEMIDNRSSPYKQHISQNRDRHISTITKTNDYLSTDYVCSPNNLSNFSDRQSPNPCDYNDNYFASITDPNYAHSSEFDFDEVLDLSLHKRSQRTLEDGSMLPSEAQSLDKFNNDSMIYPDVNNKPPVSKPTNISETLCSSYTTNIFTQSAVNIKSPHHVFNFNNFLQNIYNLPIMHHIKTLSTSVNSVNNNDTINKTVNNSLSTVSISDNTSTINKMFPVHSTMSTTLIQKKNSYKDAPKLITCPIAGCQQKFPWNSSLKRHILTHTPHKPFACTRCTKSFSTKSNRERHMERVHRVSLKRQRQRFHQSSVSIQSPSSGDNRSELSGHNSNLYSVSRTNIGDNDQELDNIEELREDEILSMNSNEKQAEDISNSLLIRAGDPVVEPNPERLYNAALLAVVNSTRNALPNYLNNTPSTCINDVSRSILPNVSVRLRQSGRGGRRPRRGNMLSIKNNVLDRGNANQTTFNAVPQTGKTINSTLEDLMEPPVDLSLHSTSKNTSTLSCPVCSVQVASRCFRRHLTLHQLDNPVFRCHLCQLTFQDQVSTLTHWAMNHPNEWAKFVGKLSSSERSADILTQIQLSLSRSNQTRVDLEREIGNNGNLTESKDPLNYSMKTGNHDMRYVSCCVCLHRFGSQQDLQRHMRSHTGERPFVCPHCGKEFSLKHSMHRHARVHIKESVRTTKSKDIPLSTSNNSCAYVKIEEMN